MKILLWSQYFWPETFHINDLAKKLASLGMSVTVLTGKPNYPDGAVFPGYKARGICRELYAGLEICRIPLVARGCGSRLRLAINYFSFIASGFLIAPFVLRRQKCDVVFVYAPSPLLQALPAVFLAWLKKAPLIVWVQDLWPESLAATGAVKSLLMLRLVETLVRYIYRHSDSILIQSEAFRESVARLACDPQKIRYFPNTAEIAPNAVTHSVPIALDIQRKFSIVFAGNIGVAQSMETILQAAERLSHRSDIVFFIVGSGSRESWLVKEVELRRLKNVFLTGRMPAASMPLIFASAAALLLTLANEPALALTVPSKLQSYLAAGKPVVACLNGEGARIVRDADAGLVCPAEDAEALSNAVLALYRLTQSERLRLGENGRRYFHSYFEPTRRAEELVEHFQSMLLLRQERQT